jgi:DinB superfamily
MTLSHSLITRLQFQHQTVRELIEGRNGDQLKLRAIPDKWSAFENIAHLVSYQPVFHVRLEKILSETNPSFERYVADTDPEFEACRGKPLNELLQSLNLVRSEILGKVNNLAEDQVARVATHPKYGPLNIIQWTEFFLLHEAHHLFTIFQLLRLGDKEIGKEEKS